MTISTVINIILDYLFIFVYKWGLTGAAVATGIGEIVGCILMVAYLLRYSPRVRLGKLKFSWKSIQLTARNSGYIIRLGFSAFLGEAAIGVMMLTAFAGSIITVFVAGPISVGEKRYFLEGTQYRFDINNILHGFTCGKYLNVVFTNLLVNIFTAFWTLLFIIPGIIKGYAYAMTPYILAENPNIKPMQAINLSCRMTKGHKLDLFVLGFSFIGWYMLGALAFGIGTAFVVPYDRATHAQFYLALRSEALNKGTVTLQELEYGL